jgi:hypothetical protein
MKFNLREKYGFIAWEPICRCIVCRLQGLLMPSLSQRKDKTMQNSPKNNSNSQKDKGGKPGSDAAGGKSMGGKDQRSGSDKSVSRQTSQEED